MTDQIESYNGIMLCKRPILGAPVYQSHTTQKLPPRRVLTQAKASLNDKKSSGTFWKPSGGSTRSAEKNKVIKRLNKNDSALRRHKQWLKQMQAQREEKIRNREEEVKRKEEIKREFTAKQAKKRARAVDDLKETDDFKDHRNDNVDHYVERSAPISADKRCRPVWALTEMEAQATHDNKEQQEEKDLLDFVEKLDCDSFCEDLELKVLINQVKDRIRILEKEKNKDESKLRAVMENEMANIRSEHFNSPEFVFDEEMLGESDLYTEKDDDMRSIANSLRSCSNDSVSSIHSRKSIQALISKAKERLSNTSNMPKINEESPCYGAEVSMNYPLTITHSEDDGARLRETKSLNKLPFKNRNPAL